MTNHPWIIIGADSMLIKWLFELSACLRGIPNSWQKMDLIFINNNKNKFLDKTNSIIWIIFRHITASPPPYQIVLATNNLIHIVSIIHTIYIALYTYPLDMEQVRSTVTWAWQLFFFLSFFFPSLQSSFNHLQMLFNMSIEIMYQVLVYPIKLWPNEPYSHNLWTK